MLKYCSGAIAGAVMAITLMATTHTEQYTFASTTPEPETTYTNEETECLAKTIYFEARGESLAGKLAVGLVVINRTKAKSYPASICGVVQQAKVNHKGTPINGKCQFKYYCDGKPDRPESGKEWDESIMAANAILHKNVFDITQGSMYYHTNNSKSTWTKDMKKVATIDNHVFFK